MSDYPALGRAQPQLPGEGVTDLDPDGNLKPEILTIVELIAQHDVALATGHLHLREIRKLQDAVLRHGDVKFLVTHANWALCKLDLEVQRELMTKGAYLEYVASSCVSLDFMEQDPDELASRINEFFFGGGGGSGWCSDLTSASSADLLIPKGCACCWLPFWREGSSTNTSRR